MGLADIREELEGRLGATPILDAHTHLVGGRLGARGLHDILLYHMCISDLYAAGCPSGKRLTEYPNWPDHAEAEARIAEAIPHLPHVRNTSMMWILRLLLRELYGWEEEITADNWRRLDGIIRERADDRAWHREIIRRANIQRLCTEWARRSVGPDGTGPDDALLQYSLEWAFFSRCQWGEYDTAVYELERCWGREPESPTPIGGTRPQPDRSIRTLEDVYEAVEWFVGHIPADQITSNATHISTDVDFRPVSDAEMSAALARRGSAGPAERDVYASYINEAFLCSFEKHFGDTLLFQFSTAAEPLPFETSSRISQRTLAQLGEMIGRHPGVRFQCHVSSAHANQTLCTLCRELPNLSLAGYWWHNFFPAIVTRIMDERLDMVPTNKQVGFISDAYCIEWTYAKSRVVRQLLAEVLAAKVARGMFSTDTAAGIAHEIFFEAPRTLCGMRPAAGEV